ncbi:MAG: hypothetical protein Q8O40_05295 [Chloroflexota bacterium]|nr:hypothetical protein [Chloroflexota bacterium]
MILSLSMGDIAALSGLGFQSLGIVVGAGFVYETLFKSDLIRVLATLIGASQTEVTLRLGIVVPRPMRLPASLKAPQTIQATVMKPGVALLALAILTTFLAVSLGVWGFLLFRLNQSLTRDVRLGTHFWQVFGVWLGIVAAQYAASVPAQLTLQKRWSNKSVGVGDAVFAFFRNWYASPIVALKCTLIFLLIVVLMVPAWVGQVDVTRLEVRQRYYLTYSASCLLLGTVLQAIGVVYA